MTPNLSSSGNPKRWRVNLMMVKANVHFQKDIPQIFSSLRQQRVNPSCNAQREINRNGCCYSLGVIHHHTQPQCQLGWLQIKNYLSGDFHVAENKIRAVQKRDKTEVVKLTSAWATNSRCLSMGVFRVRQWLLKTMGSFFLRAEWRWGRQI